MQKLRTLQLTNNYAEYRECQESLLCESHKEKYKTLYIFLKIIFYPEFSQEDTVKLIKRRYFFLCMMQQIIYIV